MVKPRRKGMTQEQVLIAHGVASGFEKRICGELTDKKISYGYESVKLKYRVESDHIYTPDIVLPNGILVELKGYFPSEQQKIMLWVKKCNPDKDIRMVFEKPSTLANPDSKKKRLEKKEEEAQLIRDGKEPKKSKKLTYGTWCEKHGFPYAEKHIPTEWLT